MSVPPENSNSDFPSKSSQGITDALGQSEVFLAFQERLSAIAPINRPVLLIGERGTGKELAAARLHYLSRRWQHPLITLNCSALSPSLIESELFGHERGAFTGATSQRAGRFEMADQGSFFLDEIGNIPLQAQEKILRVVEYGSFERVGSSRPVEVDARIIAATNADLSEMAERGRFMKDLLDRLSFEVLYLPPLRVRKGDIPLLANHFAARMAFEIGRDAMPAFTADAMAALEAYSWPGNIRELKNVVERAVYRSTPEYIDTIVFDPFENPYPPEEKRFPEATVAPQVSSPPAHSYNGMSLPQAVWSLKVRMLEDALKRAQYNQAKAARLLGMTYHQFRALYRKYQQEAESIPPKTGGTEHLL